jgi:hypothetical protein
VLVGGTMPIHQGCWALSHSSFTLVMALQVALHQRNPCCVDRWTNHSEASGACFLFSAGRVIGGYDVLVALQLSQVASGAWHAEAGVRGVLSGSAVPCFSRVIFGCSATASRCRSAVTASFSQVSDCQSDWRDRSLVLPFCSKVLV